MMRVTMKTVFAFLLGIFIASTASGFQLGSPLHRHHQHPSELSSKDIICSKPLPASGATLPSAAANIIAAAATLMSSSPVLAAEDLEMADLPPAYVPVLFGVVLLGGVGWLTASLGNVMDEEASLGFQSGARAKKEMERSRSSYFTKK